MSDQAISPLDFGLLILLAVIFGAAFMLTKVAVEQVPPMTLVLGRFVGALMILIVAMLIARQSFPAMGVVWIYLLASAVFGNTLPFMLISWGQISVDAGLAAILMAIMPLTTIVIAHFFTRDEKLNVFKIIGFVLGLFGVIVLIGFEKLATLGGDTIHQFAVLGGAFCYAINAVITKKLIGLPGIAMGTAQMGISAIIMLVLCLALGQPLILQISDAVFVSWVLLAIFPTALGTLLILSIVKRQGAGFLSQINFMVPIAGVFWGMIILNESLPLEAWTALALILAGVAISRLKRQSILNPIQKKKA